MKKLKTKIKTEADKPDVAHKVGSTKTRREFRDARSAMREAQDLPSFFSALFTMLTVAEHSVFTATKYDKKTGAPVAGKYVKVKDREKLYFHFDDASMSRIPIKDDVMSFLVRNVKKRGMTVLTLEGMEDAQLALEYKSVVIWQDHHGTDYAIKITATAVNNAVTI